VNLPALVAPDSFKGTFSATEVADAVARGLESGGVEAVRLPVADGGEGTMDTLLGALDGERRTATVTGPLGDPVEATFALVEAGDTGVVECAQASGLGLVAESDRDPVAASTYGTGELIAAACEAGATTVLVAVGGSATTDGGEGAVRALADAGLQPRLEVICDVRTPFEHAARVYAPQKGADAEQVRELTRRLERQAQEAPRDPRGRPLTGAAGGLAGGLWAHLGATLVPGATYVLDRIGFDTAMRASAFVVTGEGALDRQTLQGKLVGEVATRSRQAGVRSYAVVGRRELDLFEARILDLERVIEATTAGQIEAAGAELAALVRT
jgi:glycerate kinase